MDSNTTIVSGIWAICLMTTAIIWAVAYATAKEEQYKPQLYRALNERLEQERHQLPRGTRGVF